MKKHPGFTLVELLVTIFLIAVLFSLAISSYMTVGERAKAAEAKGILFKAFAGYQRLLIEEERIQGNPWQLTWQRCGMSDPNADPRRFFDYSFQPNANAPQRVRAVRQGNTSRWLEVDLTTGRLNKSAPY